MAKKNPYNELGELLAAFENSPIKYVDELIISKDEAIINRVADVLDAFGYTAVTGYFDPAEDKKAGEEDKFTGYYYVDI